MCVAPSCLKLAHSDKIPRYTFLFSYIDSVTPSNLLWTRSLPLLHSYSCHHSWWLQNSCGWTISPAWQILPFLTSNHLFFHPLPSTHGRPYSHWGRVLLVPTAGQVPSLTSFHASCHLGPGAWPVFLGRLSGQAWFSHADIAPAELTAREILKSITLFSACHLLLFQLAFSNFSETFKTLSAFHPLNLCPVPSLPGLESMFSNWNYSLLIIACLLFSLASSPEKVHTLVKSTLKLFFTPASEKRNIIVDHQVGRKKKPQH